MTQPPRDFPARLAGINAFDTPRTNPKPHSLGQKLDAQAKATFARVLKGDPKRADAGLRRF